MKKIIIEIVFNDVQYKSIIKTWGENWIDEFKKDFIKDQDVGENVGQCSSYNVRLEDLENEAN